MKKNISINLQGIIFHIEEDGYDVLARYLAGIKAHFAGTQGQADIVADIEGRMAELFAARLSPSQQVITLADVEQMMAKMGQVSDFADADEAGETAPPTAAGSAASSGPRFVPPTEPDGSPRKLYRDMAHRKIAGVAAGLAQDFRVNPLWVRIGFVVLALLLPSIDNFGFDGVAHGRLHLGSWGFLAYVLLWIVLPKRYDAPAPLTGSPFDGATGGPQAGKRLFRDTDGGKVGGVAAGLAYYLQVDVVIVRVLLLLGLFAAGSTLVVYVILWIVVPEARSLSEKLQMRGNAVTISTLSDEFQATAGQEPSSGGRSIGTYLEGAARGAQPAVNFLGSLIRWFVGGILIVMGASFLFSVGAVLAAALGIVPADSVIHGSTSMEASGVLRNVPAWGAWAGFLALGIPSLSLILLGLRLILRRAALPRTAGLSLLGLWILGLMGSLGAASVLTREFHEHGTVSIPKTLAPVAGNSIVLALRDQPDYLENVHFRLAPADSNAAPSVVQEFEAQGRTQALARETAANTVTYGITQLDSTITFDEGLTLKSGAAYRAQELNLTLRLPLGKTYSLSSRFIDRLSDESFLNNRQPTDDEPHRFRLSRRGQLECLDCPPAVLGTNDEERTDNVDTTDASDGVDNNDEDNFNITINSDDDDSTGVAIKSTERAFSTDLGNYGPSRLALTEPESFREIEASGDYRVFVRQGPEARVEAAGAERDIRELRLSIDNGSLRIRRRDRNSFLPSLNFNRRPVLVRVTVPALDKLDLSGACRADVAGFRDVAFALEGTGACVARLDVAVPLLNIDLSGVSRVVLRGRADKLIADGAGACKIEALALRTDRTFLDLSGVSQARVNARTELNADLSGASRVRYTGNPSRVSKDLSGGSSLRAL